MLGGGEWQVSLVEGQNMTRGAGRMFKKALNAKAQIMLGRKSLEMQ